MEIQHVKILLCAVPCVLRAELCALELVDGRGPEPAGPVGRGTVVLFDCSEDRTVYIFEQVFNPYGPSASATAKHAPCLHTYHTTTQSVQHMYRWRAKHADSRGLGSPIGS